MKQASGLTNSQIAQSRRDMVVAAVKPWKLSSLSEAHSALPDLLTQLRARGLVNPRTGKAYSAQTIRRDLAETIGQWTHVKPQWNARVLLNVDSTWRDYVFWDALRRGTAAGYEFSGPSLGLPAAQKIASYVYGDGITAHLLESSVTDKQTTALHESLPLSEADGKPTQAKKSALKGKNQTQQQQQGPRQPLQMVPKAKPSPAATSNVAWTNVQLNQWLRSIPKFLLDMTVDDYCLGDQYVFLNPDCSLSVASPETVTVEYSASDYRRIERVVVRTKMQNARTEDIYTPDKRTLIIRYYDGRGTVTQEYENLLGRIPMVHFANDRSSNEIYGRPIYSGGLPVMARIDDLMRNTLEGVNILAMPIPMFIGMDNPEAAKKEVSTAVNYVDAEGNQQVEYKLRLDRQTGLFFGKGADGKMLAPQVGFTKDTLDTLHELKLFWLNETHIPEFMLGGAIASSKASTETQVPPFVQYVKFRRMMLEGDGWNPELGIEARGGLLELIYLWLSMYKLLNPRIVVGPVQIDWPEIDLVNDQTKYLWGSFLSSTGKITDETALRMSGYIKDPAGEVMKAAGKGARPKQFDDYSEQLRAARLAAAKDSLEPPDGPGWWSDYITPEMDKALASGVNSTYAHEHFDAEPSQDEWNILGPLNWFGMFGGHNG